MVLDRRTGQGCFGAVLDQSEDSRQSTRLPRLLGTTPSDPNLTAGVADRAVPIRLT